MSRPFRLIAIAVEPTVLTRVKTMANQIEIRVVATAAEWDALTSEISDETQDIILCGSEPNEVSSIEMAQALSSLCAATPLYFVSAKTDGLQFKNLTKNGFKQVFLLPTDHELLKEAVAKAELAATGNSQKLYRGVSLFDIGGDEALEFEVSIFMPLNKKYLKVVNCGNSIQGGTLEKLKKYNVNKVYIDPNQLQEFYKYSAKRLKALNLPDGSISETERTERLHQSIRKIFFSVFDTSTASSFDSGKEMLADTHKVVSEAIGVNGVVNTHSEISKLLNQAAEESSRDARISTLAALFEMTLGLKQTQQAAIAGLFCNIGKASLDAELQTKNYRDMTPEEKQKYEQHPAHSLRLLQNKRMIISPEVQNAILQHHERADGSGYPNRLTSAKISALAQVVSIAEQFDDLAFGQENLFRDPVAILNAIKNNKTILSEYINPLIALFQKSTAAA